MAYKKMQIVISGIVSLGILFMLLQKINISAIISAIKNANLFFIFFAAAVSLTMQIILAPLGWRYLLSGFGCNISFKESIFIKLAVIPLKGFLPLKSGELFRCIYLHKQHNMNFKDTLKAVFLSLVMSSITIFTIFVISGLLIRRFSLITKDILWLTLLCLFILAITYSLNYKKIYQVHFFNKLRSFFAVFNNFSKIKALRLWVVYFAIEIFEIGVVLLLFRALNIPVPFLTVLFFIPVLMVISSLPIAVLGFGTREAGMVILFAGFSSADNILGAALLYSSFCYLFPAVLGLSCTVPFLRLISDRSAELGKRI